jgi:hypothetical protein
MVEAQTRWPSLSSSPRISLVARAICTDQGGQHVVDRCRPERLG